MSKEKELTQEELAAKVAALEADKAALENEAVELDKKNKKLAADLKKTTKIAEAKTEVHTFEVDETDEEGEPPGNVLKYKFVAPAFNVDRKEYTAAEAKEDAVICAHLVHIGSGIIELVEEGGK